MSDKSCRVNGALYSSVRVSCPYVSFGQLVPLLWWWQEWTPVRLLREHWRAQRSPGIVMLNIYQLILRQEHAPWTCVKFGKFKSCRVWIWYKVMSQTKGLMKHFAAISIYAYDIILSKVIAVKGFWGSTFHSNYIMQIERYFREEELSYWKAVEVHVAWDADSDEEWCLLGCYALWLL
jgi:hypothetical protein